MTTDVELLDLPPGIGQVTSSVVFEVLDRSHNVVTTLNPRSDTGAAVQVRAADTIKRTLNGFALTPGDYAMIDANADRIRPSWVMPGGTRYPLGVFLFSQVNRKPRSWGVPMDGTLYDQTVIVDQPINYSVSIPKGAVLDPWIRKVLSGLPLPFQNIPTVNTAVGTPVSWAAGESRYTILSGLFKLANYYPPFFDNEGTLVGKPIPAGLQTSGYCDHSYSYGPASRIISDSINEADETITAPNRYLVLDNGPTQQPIVGWYDIAASWPHSAANRGYVVTQKVDINGMPGGGVSGGWAAVQAMSAAITDMRSGFTTIDFDATPDPRHDIFQVVEWNGVCYREAAWSLKLQPGGPMSHTLIGLY